LGTAGKAVKHEKGTAVPLRRHKIAAAANG